MVSRDFSRWSLVKSINYRHWIAASRKWRVLLLTTARRAAMRGTIVCRWTMFAISTIFRVNTIYCNTIQHRLHRAMGERNSFDGVPGDIDAPSHWLGISHVINLSSSCASAYLLPLFTISHITVLVPCTCATITRGRVEASLPYFIWSADKYKCLEVKFETNYNWKVFSYYSY